MKIIVECSKHHFCVKKVTPDLAPYRNSVFGQGRELSGSSICYVHEDLSSTPRNHVRELGMVAQALIRILGRQRQEDAWDLMATQPTLPSEPQANGRPGLKNK